MKSLFEHFGGTYHNESDYLIPNLTLPKSQESDIGIYGQQHLRYLQEYLRLTYINLLTSGRIDTYLSKIDKQAYERFSRIVEQMKQEQGVPEQLKEKSSLEWVKRMTCIRQQADKTVLKELIYS